VHLADLANDMGESRNLVEAEPETAAELKAAAESWRADIDAHWGTHWAARATNHTGHPGRE
jgi:hypothetical protein